VLLVPTLAWANVGVPMLAVAWPVSWVAFIPICILEAVMAKRMLKLTVYQAAKVSVLANLVSTLVGIPLAWLIAGVAGYASFYLSIAMLPKSVEWLSAPFRILAYSAWMPPISSAPWLVMVAGVVLCMPFYIASVMIETEVAIELLSGTPPKEVRRWCKRANQISYLAIATVIQSSSPVRRTSATPRRRRTTRTCS